MSRVLPSILALVSLACGSPPDPAALGYRAAVEGDHEAAAAHYASATEARPEDAEAWMGLARERLRAGLEATEAADRAVALDGSADALELLGRAMLASPERRPEAGRALERALELDPDRSRLLFALGRAYEAAGDREAAIHAYRSSSEAEVLPARALIAAVRLSLDLHEEQNLPVGAMLEESLDRAATLAVNDQDAQRAIAAQRRRMQVEFEPDLSARGFGPEPLGARGLDSLFRDTGTFSGETTFRGGVGLPAFGERAAREGFRSLEEERRPGPSVEIGTLGTRGETVGPTGGRGSRRLDE